MAAGRPRRRSYFFACRSRLCAPRSGDTVMQAWRRAAAPHHHDSHDRLHPSAFPAAVDPLLQHHRQYPFSGRCPGRSHRGPRIPHGASAPARPCRDAASGVLGAPGPARQPQPAPVAGHTRQACLFFRYPRHAPRFGPFPPVSRGGPPPVAGQRQRGAGRLFVPGAGQSAPGGAGGQTGPPSHDARPCGPSGRGRPPSRRGGPSGAAALLGPLPSGPAPARGRCRRRTGRRPLFCLVRRDGTLS